MENKKGIFQNQHSNLPQASEASKVETYVRHTNPLNSSADQSQRNLQYGLKRPNHIVQQINPSVQNFQYNENHYKVIPSPENFNNIGNNFFNASPNYLQFQKSGQNPVHYKPTHVPPPSSLAHNVTVPNSSQIWVPQQPLTIQHQPQQSQKPEYQKSAPLQTPAGKSKEVERKKYLGSSQLKSPSAKRPPEAPVAKQGWLHKQGSEGLMLWKKRWFVLSEYCLFYYKGPEEEKLLGSILLPSYKVSVCKLEEKISKKYAFKCEHANMRTYILAADSQEQMMQWVQLLNLASLMQNNADQSKLSNSFNTPSQQQVIDTYETNEQPHQRNNLHLTIPGNAHSPSSSILQDQCSYNQPLYANAPPKPRRLNDGFSSPSPDILDRHNPQYIESRNMNKSPNPAYCTNVSYNSKGSRDSLIGAPEEFQRIHVERRTPDTYGRSKLENHPTDYEDVYSGEVIYKRPLSPVAYNQIIKKSNPPPINPSHRYYSPVNMMGPTEALHYPAPQMRKVPNINIARPHSADFLEYELNHKVQNSANLLKQRPRPKSSLDINVHMHDNDNDFYSRERYAEKMRKSAQYLKHVPPKFMDKPMYPPNGGVRCSGYENTFPFVASHSHLSNINQLPMYNIQKPQPVRSRSVLSDENRSMDVNNERMRYVDRGVVSPDMAANFYSDRYRNPEYDQFTRSASARLAYQVERIPGDNRNIHRDGERKREESMRRLLEWKQRMLQSPLNRKIQGNIAYRGKTDIYNNNDMGYKVAKSRKRTDTYLDDYRSKNSTQYNSYSSDDEENEKKNLAESQAGRTLDTFASNCEAPTPAQSLSTTVLSTSIDPAKPKFHLNLHDSPYSNVNEQLLVSRQDGSQKPTFSRKDLDDDSNFLSEYPDEAAKSGAGINKSILSTFEQKTCTEKNYAEESIAIEENYMPMSPSKKILGLAASYDSVLDTMRNSVKMDENHYVEMTEKAVGCFSISSLNSTQSSQHHDAMIIGEEKLEPLYMELRSPEHTNEDDFTDVLITPEVKLGSKSGSSDADDEASKDLDSLDTPSQPRFSLSDTFRPASYYLGSSQVNSDLQDSSDSELVSPPPIPSSPPPLDELQSVRECTYTNVKLTEEQLSDNTITNVGSEPSMSTNAKKQTRTPETNSPLNNKSTTVNQTKSDNSDSDDDTFKSSKTMEYEMQFNRRQDSDLRIVDSELPMDTYATKIHPNSMSFHEYENLILSQYDINATMNVAGKESVEPERMIFTEIEPQQISRPTSSTSTSAEINSLLQNSNRSTPIINKDGSIIMHPSNTFCPTSAPYYYSDLSITMTDSQSSLITLNNQRSTLKCKRDITHIKNPIRGNLRDISSRTSDYTTFKLAAEARSASADFLNLTDKAGHIDNKNIYESNSIQRTKTDNSDFGGRNLLTFTQNNKFTSADSVTTDVTVRRTHSLEGLLENVLKDGSVSSVAEQKNDISKSPVNQSEGSYLWEEDSIWRERLRSASQRHTKSMENLDMIGEGDSKRKSKSPRGITRGVTYVNENYIKVDKQPREPESSKIVKYPENRIKKDGSFILDREKLRQWDLMSSAPSDNQLATAVASQVQDGNNIVVEISDGTCESTEIIGNPQTASGSISINHRDISQLSQRGVSAQKTWMPTNSSMESSQSITNLSRNSEKDFSSPNPRIYYSNQSSSHSNLAPPRQENWAINEKVSVSAGELLGRTHEELVLLLIQLRRQSAQTLQAIENYYNEVDIIQTQLYTMDQTRRMENLQKLEQIKQHLLDLEKQYEKGKPLVNLVDNMVKLGSLYRVPQDKSNVAHHIQDRIEFNQQIQERRLLAEEKREWNRLNTNHFQFQEKVQQLYMLDRLIHEESGTLQNLQQDKEDIERALGGLRHRLSKGFKDPSEIELARKQQIMLENELIRVHFMLAQNSKKLEETVSGNAKLEQELMVLKQKLQSSTLQNSPQYSNPGDSLSCTASNSPALESDLHKVEKTIGELQQQRQKLSLQVRQLTDRSSNLAQQKFPTNDSQNNSMNKKRIHSLWRETDLDTMSITDHGEYDTMSPRIKPSPLYINTNSKYEDYDFYHDNSMNQSNDGNLMSNIPQEKQEIKTVRIVKRESEKRQRDRDKSVPGKWDPVQEEDNSSDNCNKLFKSIPTQTMQSSQSLVSSSEDIPNGLTSSNSISSPNLSEFADRQEETVNTASEKPHDISPVFKSEAARQIITEMSIQQPPKQSNRRAVPKEKRRHYTAPHDQLILKSMHQLPTDIDTFDKHSINSRRARDDLDMERALRQRIDAPDIVRSTLINTELKYNERTIDDLLGTPGKINIPERYIPEQLPQLSVEEQEYRLRKVETIKKMLSDTTFISTSSTNLSGENQETNNTPTQIINKATTKILDEKKQREHLLQLNQILAKQVMEMSKIVAEKATAKLACQQQTTAEEDDLSPLTPLPLYQQRDNFYS